MHDKLMKLMEKKKAEGKKLSGSELDAKKKVVDELKALSRGGDLDALKELKADKLKKVSVMSDSEEGLKEGLDKAKEVVEKMPEMGMEESSEEKEESDKSPAELSEQESEESKEEEKSELLDAAKDMDADQLEKMIEELKKLKEEKSSQ